MKALVELGLDINKPQFPDDPFSPEGPVSLAAAFGHLEVTRWLLDRGAVINHEVDGRVRCMALFSAAGNGHLEIVKLLVERGAAVHSVWHGMNTLMHAEGRPEMEEYLRSLGLKDLRETTPPNYPQAHQWIESYMISERGNLSELQWELPGDPFVKIRHIPAGPQLNEQTLFTVGLSDHRLPMEGDPYAATELRLTLPADWPLDVKSLQDVRWNWPLEWLKKVAIEFRTATKMPESPALYPNGTPPQPFALNTRLSGCMSSVSGRSDSDGGLSLDLVSWPVRPLFRGD